MFEEPVCALFGGVPLRRLEGHPLRQKVGTVGEQSRSPSGVNEENPLVGSEYSLADEFDQAGHRLAGVYRVKEEPLEFGYQPNGFDYARGHLPITRADEFVVYIGKVSRDLVPDPHDGRDAIGQIEYLIFKVCPREDCNACDSDRPTGRVKSGEKPALSSDATGGHHNMIKVEVHFIHLADDFKRTLGIPERSYRTGTAERDDIGSASFTAQLFRRKDHLGGDIGAVRIDMQHRIGEVVQKDIAPDLVVVRGSGFTIFKEDVTLHPELCCRGGCLARMVRLQCTAGKDGIDGVVLSQSVAKKEFEFPDLVAAKSETGAVVSLAPDLRSSEMLRQPGHGLYRGGQVGEAYSGKIAKGVHVMSPMAKVGSRKD